MLFPACQTYWNGCLANKTTQAGVAITILPAFFSDVIIALASRVQSNRNIFAAIKFIAEQHATL